MTQQQSHVNGSSGNNQVSEPTVFLLGAGFSVCVTEGALPAMTGFFDRLVPTKYPDLHEFVVCTSSDLTKANVEEVIGLLDQLVDSPLSDIGDRITRCRNKSDIKRQLGQYCLDRLCCGHWKEDHWATCFLAMADVNTTVITTNYDNLAESILSCKVGATHFGTEPTCHHCRMRKILLKDCECSESLEGTRPHWRGSVLKLHGSVAWKTCYNPKCRQYDCLIADRHCRPFDGCACDCCGQPCYPVLVLPSHHKKYTEHPHLNRMWNSAAEALGEAECLVIFGFSLPKSDYLVNHMVQNAFNKKRIKRVVVIDIHPDAIATRVRAMLPREAQVEVLTFAVPMDGTEPTWLHRESEKVT